MQAYVEIQPIKLTKINEFYYKKNSTQTRRLIGELFLQKNVPRLIDRPDGRHLILDFVYDERDAATLDLWSRLCEYPPTHRIVVGYLSSRKKVESVSLLVSLRPAGRRVEWAVQWLGLVISRFLAESKTNYLITPRRDNAEFWLQCVLAVVCGVREG